MMPCGQAFTHRPQPDALVSVHLGDAARADLYGPQLTHRGTAAQSQAAPAALQYPLGMLGKRLPAVPGQRLARYLPARELAAGAADSRSVFSCLLRHSQSPLPR